MTSIIVRGLDESVKQRLAALAKEHGRSMEAEARDILTRAVKRPHIGRAFLDAGRRLSGDALIPVPERSDEARAVEFE